MFKSLILIILIQIVIVDAESQISILVFDQVAETYSPNVMDYQGKKPFYHNCIPAANEMLKEMADSNNWNLTFAQDLDSLTSGIVEKKDVMIFNNVGGDFLTHKEQKFIEQFVMHGGGVIGIHMATAAERDWKWYHDMFGGVCFTGHPPMQKATIRLESEFSQYTLNHSLPDEFEWEDEWYEFDVNPRSKVKVLMTVDETTYEGGKRGTDHPVAWFHDFDGGKVFYTALGHKPDHYEHSYLKTQIRNAILFVSDNN